jgi:hypothetical protein
MGVGGESQERLGAWSVARKCVCARGVDLGEIPWAGSLAAALASVQPRVGRHTSAHAAAWWASSVPAVPCTTAAESPRRRPPRLPADVSTVVAAPRSQTPAAAPGAAGHRPWGVAPQPRVEDIEGHLPLGPWPGIRWPASTPPPPWRLGAPGPPAGFMSPGFGLAGAASRRRPLGRRRRRRRPRQPPALRPP